MPVKRHGLKVFIIVMVVTLAAVACVYLLAFGTFTIVSDAAYSQILPSGLGFRLALKGMRLRIVQLDEQDLHDEKAFVDAMSRVGGRYVLLGPVSSSYAVGSGIDVSSLLPDSTVLAMTRQESRLFDCTLVSDERSGWLKAAASVNSEISATSQNAALVYESSVIDYVDDIVGSFDYGRLTVFENNGTSNLFVMRSMDEMDGGHILIALCPYLAGLDGFFTRQSTVKWIVDYRFVPTVPTGNLYGVVLPSLDSLVSAAKGSCKGSHGVMKLEYRYEKR